MRDWPLIGREDETAALAALVAAGDSIVLGGPAGAGKTRLAAVAGEHAAAAGAEVLRLVGSPPAAAFPLGVVAPLLEEAPGDGANTLLHARAALERRAAGRRLVLVIDDAQWLDDASAVLVHQLVAAGTLTVVASVRTGERAPEPVVALWKDGLATRLDVAPLAAPAVGALLEAVLGGPVESADAAHFVTHSGGNVLYLRELVEGALEAGTLVEQDGLWRLKGRLPVSDRLSEIVAGRIGRLDDTERAVVELVAVAEPIDLALLEEVVEPIVVERLDARGLLTVSREAGRLAVRTGHPIYGDVLRAGLPDLGRRRMCRQLADALEHRRPTGPGDVLRLALWRLDGGGTTSPEHLVAAARQAYFANDVAKAERLARSAWDRAPSFDAGHLLADALYALGRHAESDGLLQQMAPLAEGDEQRALVALARGIALFWGLANDVAADDVLAEAEAEAEAGSPAWQAELRATRATLRSQAGRHRQALALLDDLPDPIPSDRAAVQAALAEAFALPAVGRAEDALKVIDAATDVHGRLGRQLTLYQSGLLLAARSMALVDLGRLGEAAELASLGLHVSLDSGDTSARGYFAATLGWVRLNQGLLDTAQRHYREAAACFRAVGHRGPRRWALGGLLFAAALARDRTTAAEAADTLAEVGPHPAALFEQRIDRGRAWLALAEGQPVVARRTMEDIAERARALGHVVEEAATLHDLARIGQARAVTARLEELAAQTDGELVPLQAADAAARASGDPVRLGDVAEGFASLGAFLWAAESASGAAEAAAKMGDQRAAVRWARRATELAERCQGVSVPVLGPSEAPVALTRREREIALLAASGEPSRAIAERLYVSVRTVDNHLARIYTKLGVGGRAELAAALGLA